MRIDVYFHSDDLKPLFVMAEKFEGAVVDLHYLVNGVNQLLKLAQEEVVRDQHNQEELMALNDDILAAAERGNTIGDSVVALVQQLVQASGGDPAKLQQALAFMQANNDKVEAAVVANTPQAPPA